MKSAFYNSPADCKWLRETALKPSQCKHCPAFLSFIMHGNEDCPEKLELYNSRNPLTTDIPAVFVYFPEVNQYFPV